MSRERIGVELRNQGRRLTKQRLAILDVLRSTTSHPDAYWIYEQVRRDIPNVSLGTIYRSLNVLRDLDLVKELAHGDQHSRYDGNVSDHGHVTCLRCGRIVDVTAPQGNGNLSRSVEEESGFEIRNVRLEFEGICPACQESEQRRTTARNRTRCLPLENRGLSPHGSRPFLLHPVRTNMPISVPTELCYNGLVRVASTTERQPLYNSVR